MDESRNIASEYVDGEQSYSMRDSLPYAMNDPFTFGYQPAQSTGSVMSDQPLSAIQGMHSNDNAMQQQQQQQQSVNLFDHPQDFKTEQQQQQQPPGAQSVESAFTHASLPSHHSQNPSQHHSPYDQAMRDSAQTEPEYHAEAKEILNTQEETLYMQVFVEEVGLWMDSMDSMKHVCS